MASATATSVTARWYNTEGCYNLINQCYYFLLVIFVEKIDTSYIDSSRRNFLLISMLEEKKRDKYFLKLRISMFAISNIYVCAIIKIDHILISLWLYIKYKINIKYSSHSIKYYFYYAVLCGDFNNRRVCRRLRWSEYFKIWQKLVYSWIKTYIYIVF